MPAVLALPAFWGALAAGTAGAAGIYGANKSSETAQQGQKQQADANADAIAEQQRQDAIQKQEFDQQQAAAKAQWDAEQNIRAPYRAAGSAALGSLGDILGVNFRGGGGAPSGSGTAPTPSQGGSGPTPQGIDWTASAPALTQSLTNYFQKAGVPASEVPYWVQQAPSLVARGQQLNDPNYANKRLAAADIFGGGPSSGSGTTPISSIMPKTLAPPLSTPMAANALAPSYAQVVPISSLMGGR